MIPTTTKTTVAAKHIAVLEGMKVRLAGRITETEAALEAARKRVEAILDAEQGDHAALKELSAAERAVDKALAELARLQETIENVDGQLAEALLASPGSCRLQPRAGQRWECST